MKLTLVQLSVEPGTPAENLDRACEQIRAASRAGAELVVLPELFAVGYFCFDQYTEAAEPLTGPTLNRIAGLAADEGIAVLAGSIVEDLAQTEAVDTPAAEGLANTAVLFDSDGERSLVYRKHHLFGYDSAEAELLTPGERLSVTELGGHTIGVTTCYDLRFPELYRRLADMGVTLVLVPSAWPYPRVEHWQVLPRARAIENLTYVVAANGVGHLDEAELLGRSAVYDPWGTPIARAGDEPTLVSAEADPDRVDAVREDFPALRDRR